MKKGITTTTLVILIAAVIVVAGVAYYFYRSIAAEEIRFTGTAIEYFSNIGAWGWKVSVDEVISGPQLQGYTVSVYLASVNPDQYPPGYMDPNIEPGDKVEVYGWYKGDDDVAIFGSEDYYIKKVPAG